MADKNLDPIGAVRGIPELLKTLAPPLLLFVCLAVLINQLLYFLPESWHWTVHSESRPAGMGGKGIEMSARTLLTLVLAGPLTFVVYARLKKAIQRRRR